MEMQINGKPYLSLEEYSSKYGISMGAMRTMTHFKRTKVGTTIMVEDSAENRLKSNKTKNAVIDDIIERDEHNETIPHIASYLNMKEEVVYCVLEGFIKKVSY